MPRTEARPAKTKWGDREGRRRDILDAARRQMAAGGYLGLNMRELAAGAGVSPGTLYSYFATKEEIFATLYAEAIEEHNARVEPICAAATDLEQVLIDLATVYLDLYGAYGRYFTLWSELAEEHGDDTTERPLPRELRVALADATRRQGQLVRAGLRRAAEAEGRALTDEARAMVLLWTVLNGLGDHVFSTRRHLTPFSADDLIAFAATTIAAGITVPA